MRTVFIAATAVLLLLLTSPGFVPAAVRPTGAASAAGRPPASITTTHAWEHRYRIGGKVRLLLFWAGSDDLGGARMSRRQDRPEESTISFFAASDPRRAPRRLNQWGYVREQAAADRARVFVVRSMDDADAGDPEARLARGPEKALFGAVCSSMGPATDDASLTGVRVKPTMTHDQLGEILNLIASAEWETRRGDRPAGAYPGFFTALQAAIDDSVDSLRDGILGPQRRQLVYLFKGALFDLFVRDVSRAGPDQLRGEYTFRKRGTSEGGSFTITYGIEGDLAGVPIEISFQPSWWVKVQLRLDDRADAPEDPAAPLSREIDEVCSRVLGARANQTR